MTPLIIRTIRLAHCKRGPDLCEECRAMDEERICLLELLPPGEGLGQRRTIEVTEGEHAGWWAFEVVRSFESEAEARAHAQEHGILDVEI